MAGDIPIPVGPPELQNPGAMFQQLFGRIPIMMPELLKEINEAGWPANAYVNPADFFVLCTVGPQVFRDNDGPYFYLSRTKVRPVPAELDVQDVDFSEWEPSRLVRA